MGIEPTNKGFADHLSKHCKLLNVKELNLNSMPAGPGLGPTLRFVSLRTPWYTLHPEYRLSRGCSLRSSGVGRDGLDGGHRMSLIERELA